MYPRCILLTALLAACATPGTHPGDAPRGRTPPPGVQAGTPPAPVAAAPSEPAKPATKPQPAPEPPKAEPSKAPAKAPVHASAPPPKTGAPAPAPKPAAKPAPSTAPAPAPAPLDLKTLEQRLKSTDAIGVMTKLSLKNQVDDLVSRFRAYHAGARPPTLPELRPSFELLLMKVLSLLQDKEPALAHDINASREAIWGVLSDHQKFSQLTT